MDKYGGSDAAIADKIEIHLTKIEGRTENQVFAALQESHSL